MNVNVDPALIQQALKAQISMLKLLGTLEWDETYDYKAERSR